MTSNLKPQNQPKRIAIEKYFIAMRFFLTIFMACMVSRSVTVPVCAEEDAATLDAWIFGNSPTERKSPWENEFNLSLSVGTSDNVLLSPFKKQESNFLGTEFEAFGFRIPQKNQTTTMFWYFLAERKHYLDVNDLQNEDLVIFKSQVNKQFFDHWDAGASIQYIYSDQVFEVGFNELDTTLSVLKSHQFEIRPHLTWTVASNREFELQLPVERGIFQDSSDDYTEPSVKIIIAQTYGYRSKLKASYEVCKRITDHREIRNEDGRARDGTDFRWLLQEFRTEWKHNWTRKKSLSSRARLSVKLNEDNGVGYDNFTRVKGAMKLSYKKDRWLSSLATSIAYYHYPVQLAEIDGSSKRRRTDASVSLRVERKITDRFTAFFSSQYRRNISNRSSEEYSESRFSLGLDLAL